MLFGNNQDNVSFCVERLIVQETSQAPQETQKSTVLLTASYNRIIEEDNIYDTKEFAGIRKKQITSYIKVYVITSVCRD